jgi:hypothetical protein
MTDQTTATAGDCDLSVLPPSLRDWTCDAATSGITGAQARTWLSARGWPPWVGDAAAREIDRLVRARIGAPIGPPPDIDRAHQHPLAYAMLFATVGFAALAMGSTIHLLLAWALESRSGSQTLADWVTILVCALPFAVAAARVVARIERDDPLARFSPVRDSLSMILLWAAGIVGGARLLVFVHQLVSALVVERDLSNLGRDLAHVVTVVVIAGWVFAWVWRLRQQARVDQTVAT